MREWKRAPAAWGGLGAGTDVGPGGATRALPFAAVTVTARGAGRLGPRTSRTGRGSWAIGPHDPGPHSAERLRRPDVHRGTGLPLLRRRPQPVPPVELGHLGDQRGAPALPAQGHERPRRVG